MSFVTYEQLVESGRTDYHERDEEDFDHRRMFHKLTDPQYVFGAVLEDLGESIQTRSLTPLARATARLEDYLRWMCAPERREERAEPNSGRAEEAL